MCRSKHRLLLKNKSLGQEETNLDAQSYVIAHNIGNQMPRGRTFCWFSGGVQRMAIFLKSDYQDVNMKHPLDILWDFMDSLDKDKSLTADVPWVRIVAIAVFFFLLGHFSH